MKLLVDMNLSPLWIPLLISAGWEAVHWSSVGKGDAPDREIMSYANQHDYVVITHDMDFSAILAATHGEKPSVIQIRIEDVSLPASGDRIPSSSATGTRAGCIGNDRGKSLPRSDATLATKTLTFPRLQLRSLSPRGAWIPARTLSH